jgi:hypothetical protein
LLGKVSWLGLVGEREVEGDGAYFVPCWVVGWVWLGWRREGEDEVADQRAMAANCWCN